MTDEPDKRHSLPALAQLRDDFLRVANEGPRTTPSRMRRGGRIAMLAAALLAVPAGIAVAGALDNSAVEGVPASECAAANAVYRELGLGQPDEYAPDCPTPAELEAQIEEAAELPVSPAQREQIEGIREGLRKGVLQQSSGGPDVSEDTPAP
jgi:hypothetical protein